MVALLALLGAFFWGIGDFFGGLAARRMAVLAVLALSQAIGLSALLVWLAVTRDPFPGGSELLPGAAAGVVGLVGLGALYRGMAVGAMGIVAPISAASPVVPLTVDAARGEVPSAFQWLGIIFVLVGIAALSRDPSAERRQRLAAGAALAVLAAVGFGTFIVAIDAASDESASWAVTVARTTSLMLAVSAALVLRKSLRPPKDVVPMLVAVGLFDTGATVLIAAATTHGSAGIVAVLSALYPVVTVILARIFLDELLSVGKRVGGVVALGGAALVAAG